MQCILQVSCNRTCDHIDDARAPLAKLEGSGRNGKEVVMQSSYSGQTTRRRLFSMIGAAAGATVMYNAMATRGFAAQSN
jgi:hypothetical protein